MPTAKTSHSHPLRIDKLPIKGVSGVIGLTFCPGKKQRVALTGQWDRDLFVDLQAIKSSGAKALVTLMETEELAKVQVPVSELRDKTGALGIEWHHLPIRDVDVPDDEFENQWETSGPRLRSLLLEGNKIVIHCLGGLGRTGTIAARLLVEFGASPPEAIKAVRIARTGSIETAQQENYIKQITSLS
jgi:protein-tyrosine phosphatase